MEKRRGKKPKKKRMDQLCTRTNTALGKSWGGNDLKNGALNEGTKPIWKQESEQGGTKEERRTMLRYLEERTKRRGETKQQI